MEAERQVQITINEARKKLGKEYAKLSDDEIKELIDKVWVMADIAVKKIQSK